MKDLKKYAKYFLLVFFILIIYLSYLIMKPYLLALLGAVILAYIFNPLSQVLKKKIKNKDVCATLVVIMVLALVLLPLAFVINFVLKEVASFGQSSIGSIVSALVAKTHNVQIQQYLQNFLEIGSRFFKELGSQLIYSLPTKIVSLFVLSFAFYYMVRDGEVIVGKVVELVPLKQELKERLLKEFKEVTYSSVYGLFVSGFVQGILGALAFFLFGLHNALLWGLVMMVLSVLPFAGPPLVWIPAAVYVFLNGSTISGILLVGYGLGMLLIESLMRSRILSKRTKVHPILVVLGLFGGIQLFGIVGMVLGPLLLSYLVISLKGITLGRIHD